MTLVQSVRVSTTDQHQAATELWEILSPKLSYLPKDEQEVVELAFEQMIIAHGDQRRKSGEFYIIHPVAAALTLCKIGLDSDTIAACLMHDVPEDTQVSLKELNKSFSSEIVFLIEGVTKLSNIKYKGEDRYAENLRRMFVAMSKDLRVIFIKLADRLHNLKTLEHVKLEKRKRIALESIEIYAPIAERLGISFLRGEIEDAAFPYVYPQEYKSFVKKSDLEIQRRTKHVEKLRKKVEQGLKKADIPYHKVLGRAKRYYSIYRKMQEKKGLECVYDMVALRVITFNEEMCYQVLSHLHSYFEPVLGRIKDYINKPKENGYQSIHTTVKDKDSGEIFEFQIRTKKMQEYAEYGVAAHWAYKDLKSDKVSSKFLESENMKWIGGLVELGQEKISEDEYLRRVKLDLFTDRIFVMTPKNDPINLPVGATPIDFAYEIHEDIGNTATMAKVNGEVVKLNYKLQSGDVVEIITDKKQKPKRDWLNWVISSKAIKMIRNTLKEMRKGEK